MVKPYIKGVGRCTFTHIPLKMQVGMYIYIYIYVYVYTNL